MQDHWSERLANHSVHVAIDQTAEQVDGLLQKEGMDPKSVTRLRRIARVLKLVDTRLAAVDPELISGTLLANIQKSAEQTGKQLGTFASDRNEQTLLQAMNSTDSMMNQGALLEAAIPNSTESIAEIAEAATSVRRSAGQHFANLQRDAEEAQKHLSQLEQAQKNELQEREERMSSLDERLREQKKEIDQALSHFRDQFSTDQEARQAQMTDHLDDLRSTSEAFLNDLREASSNQRERLDEDAAERLAEISAYRDQAADLVDAVGNLGVTAGFGRYAAEQKKAANGWRLVAVIVVLITVGFSVWTFASVEADASWQQLVTRVVVAALLAALAAYAGRQSSQHRDQEVRSRQNQLELAAIDPYLALLDADARTEVKKKIADRIFARPKNENSSRGWRQSSQEQPVPAAQAISALERVIESLVKRV